jgi:hypothetical protein
VFLKTASQALSNLSMSEINYPAKVLFKSANPVVTMLIGVTYLNKSYPLRDYFVVILLLVGLYLFIVADNYDKNSSTEAMPSATGLGVVYVSLSMLSGASVPMIQEHVILLHHASVDDLLFYSFLGGAILSFSFSFFNGELWAGLIFLSQSLSPTTLFIFISFCSFGFLGATCSTGITAQHGALVNGICNTFRKVTTIGLSFLMFPERNPLSVHKVEGIAVFFSGLAMRVFFKSQLSHHASGRSLSPTHGTRKPSTFELESPIISQQQTAQLIDEEKCLPIQQPGETIPSEFVKYSSDEEEDVADRENDEDFDALDESDAVRGFVTHSLAPVHGSGWAENGHNRSLESV